MHLDSLLCDLRGINNDEWWWRGNPLPHKTPSQIIPQNKVHTLHRHTRMQSKSNLSTHQVKL